MSLASEHLQEIENLAGLERRKREEIVKVTLGSLFLGNSCFPWISLVPSTYRKSFLAGSDTVGCSR